jgi:transcription elongation factor GreA-like protein
MFLDYEPGDFVINPQNRCWGVGRIQSVIKNKVTVNFENAGKKVINSKEIVLERINKERINKIE